MCAGIAQQLIGLNGRAQRHHFVGVEVAQQRLAKKCRDGFLHHRHARRAAYHDHALHIGHRQLGIVQRGTHGLQATLGQAVGGLGKIAAANDWLHHLFPRRGGKHGAVFSR